MAAYVIKCCSGSGGYLHGCMVKAGLKLELDPNVFLASAIVDMYARQ
jgi:hypothetical protein